MAWRFKIASAVAVGTFNIYVIQPRWLTEVGLVPDGTKLKMASDLIRPGFRYSSPELSADWDVRPDRVSVVTKQPDVDCGKLLAEVLDKLMWTPLTGIGVNVEFEGATSDLEQLPSGCRLPECALPSGYGMHQKSIHVALARDEHVFNFQLSLLDDPSLAVNVHTDLKDKGTQKEINKLAINACLNYLPLQTEARSLVRQLYKVELQNEQHSD